MTWHPDDVAPLMTWQVEIMHFSSLGNPNDRLAFKFQHAMRAAGYDVLHGCITAMLGTRTRSEPHHPWPHQPCPHFVAHQPTSPDLCTWQARSR
jgi:hypothetical protein